MFVVELYHESTPAKGWLRQKDDSAYTFVFDQDDATVFNTEINATLARAFVEKANVWRGRICSLTSKDSIVWDGNG